MLPGKCDVKFILLATMLYCPSLWTASYNTGGGRLGKSSRSPSVALSLRAATFGSLWHVHWALQKQPQLQHWRLTFLRLDTLKSSFWEKRSQHILLWSASGGENSQASWRWRTVWGWMVRRLAQAWHSTPRWQIPDYCSLERLTAKGRLQFLAGAEWCDKKNKVWR